MARPPRDPDQPARGAKPPRRAAGDGDDKRTKSPSAAARDARRAQQHAATQPPRPAPKPAAPKPAAPAAIDRRRPTSAARTNAAGRVTKPMQAPRASSTADRPFRPTQGDRPIRPDRAVTGGRPVRERAPFSDRPARADRAAIADRAAFTDRPARSERPVRGDRPQRADRMALSDRAPRGEDTRRPSGAPPGGSRPFDKRPARAADDRSGDRPTRPAFGARPTFGARPERGPARPDRPERGERPAFATRADRASASRRGAARHERVVVARPPAEPRAPGEGQRIAKLLARAGVASRREIERMIVEGRVAIAGIAIDTPATILKSLSGVTVDGDPVQAAAATQLFRYHKPAGLLTAERDPAGRATIYDRLPAGLPRVIPVGRLDLNTEGLLLLTTDGEFKRQLELPATGVERTYRARVFGEISQAQLEDLIEGVEIEGVRYGQIDANLERRTGRNAWVEMRLKEGKNREVRRVLEYLGLQVSRLIRTAYGPFGLEDMMPGDVDEVRQHDLVAFRKSLK